MKCEFRDAEERLEFYIMMTGSKTVFNLQTYKSLRIMQILNEVKSQKQHDEIEDKIYHQTNGGDGSEVMEKVARIAGKSGKKLKEEIAEKHQEFFKGLGRMEPEHHIKLNDNASPIVHPSRKIPIGLGEKLKWKKLV